MQKENSFITVVFILLFIVVLFYILSIGASLIIPFVIAVLFSLAIIGLSDFYKKIGYKKFKIPWFLAMIFSLATYIVIFWVIGKMMNSNIQEVIALLPKYQERLSSLYIQGLNYFQIPPTIDAYSVFQKIDIATQFTNVVSSITSIFSNAGLIFFYVMFILLEYRFFSEKIQLMFKTPQKRTTAIELIDRIKGDIKSYFLIKTIVSFTTASIAYLFMVLFWLDFALFWAMIIFFLNFIPNVWSIIAYSFPVILSLIQFDNFYTTFVLLGIFIGIEVLMGNIIEPKFMGNKLNLSPLVILIALGFWGSIWGIVGMLLSVPLMVIINIILSKFETTRPIAVLLSEKWELDVNDEENVTLTKKELIQNVKKKIDLIKSLNK